MAVTMKVIMHSKTCAAPIRGEARQTLHMNLWQ